MTVAGKLKILFVCGRNKHRSPTAVAMYKNDQRFTVASAGISEKSNHQINTKDVEWANLIVVFENKYKQYILNKFVGQNLPKIVCLDIPDEFEYMDVDLVELIDGILEYQLTISGFNSFS